MYMYRRSAYFEGTPECASRFSCHGWSPVARMLIAGTNARTSHDNLDFSSYNYYSK